MRTTPLARRLGSAALVAALSLGLAACSDDAGSADDTSSRADSGTDAGAEEPGAEESGADGSDGSDGDESSLEELDAAGFYPAVMEALKEAETFKFSATTTSQGTSSEMTGSARFGDNGIEMAASASGAQAMDMIMLDQVIYIRSEQMGLGDKWLKLDLGKGGDSLFGMLAKATDPETMFKAMEAPKKLELLGQEEVDGVATNHYRITIDPKEYMEAMDFPAAMASMLPKEMATDMWVDADNLPRKYSQAIKTPAMGAGQPTESSTEGFYSDFGTDVDIEAPPESEVSEQSFPGM